jgi:hypothetical protein
MNIPCYLCREPASSDVPDTTVVSGIVICSDCISKESEFPTNGMFTDFILDSVQQEMVN